MQKILIIFLLLLLPCAVHAQVPETYKLEFLEAIWIPKAENNKVLAMFKVTPLRKKFKRVLSMRVAYRMDGGDETVVDIMNQKEVKVQLVVYGADMQAKNPAAYNLVEDKIAQDSSNEDIFYLAFFFPKISSRPDSMRMTYGIWEGKRANKRIEQDFTFAVKKEE